MNATLYEKIKKIANGENIMLRPVSPTEVGVIMGMIDFVTHKDHLSEQQVDLVYKHISDENLI